MTRRLSLLDPINLRTSSVYRNPRNVSPLNVVIGDYSQVYIPCTPIDKEGRIQHISDLPMQWLGGVQKDGKALGYGFTRRPAYQDETGRSIACLIFDEPQYEARISVSGKGTFKLDTGELIENPADIISLVALRIQGYDEDVLDAGELSIFYSVCLKEGLIRAAILNDPTRTLKSLLDELAGNLHARWLLSDGKNITRLRGRSSEQPIRPPLFEVETSNTSEALYNQITLNFGHNPADDKFTASITKRNPISIGIYGVSEKTVDAKMVQPTRQAEALVDAMLRSYSIPQIISSFQHNLRSIHIEPGDRIAITDPGGIGENGYQNAPGEVISKETDDIAIKYSVAMEGNDDLFASELVSLTRATGSGKLGVQISYDSGMVTFFVFAAAGETLVNGYQRGQSYVDPYYRSSGSPAPLPGAAVTVNDERKTTDAQGTVRFSIGHGSYKVTVEAEGFESQEMTVTV